MDIPIEYKRNIYRAFLVFLIVLSLYFAVEFLSEFKSYGMMGSSEVNIISLSGHGEVNAVPDIANISFSINQESKTVKEAQEKVAKIEKSSLDFLEKNNILEKDIKTINASFYPKYEYKYDTEVMPCTQFNCPPRPGKNIISGYTASESITVKIRNTEDVGKIMQGLGALGVSDLNGPNFSVDDEEKLKAEARKIAIDDAKEKAEILAKDLGVSLGKITSFNESGNYGVPIYSLKSAEMVQDSTVAPAELPKGENTISSDVTLTYEIR